MNTSTRCRAAIFVSLAIVASAAEAQIEFRVPRRVAVAGPVEASFTRP